MVNWEYSESVESQEIVNIKDKYQNFINGKFQQPNSKKYINTISPSTEEVLSKIVISNEKDVDVAAEDLRLVRSSFDEFLGIKYPDDLLGDIFNDFCIGK